MPRTSSTRRMDEDLMRVLEELRLPGVQVRRSGGGGMLRMGLPDGAVVRLATVAARSTSPPAVQALLEAREGRDEVTVVVADRVSAQLRERLCEQGVGWLDRRGHLRLVHGGLVIDTDVPSLLPPSPAGMLLPRDPCTTPVGREVALELLVAPEQTPTVRGLARALGRAPSSVSSVLRALRRQGLVDDQRRALNPDLLFWALAAGWLPHRYSLRRCPDPTVERLPG